MIKKFKTTIELSEDEVQEAIKQYVWKEIGTEAFGDIKDVKLNIGKRSVGYYQNEHDEAYFEKAVVTVGDL